MPRTLNMVLGIYVDMKLDFVFWELDRMRWLLVFGVARLRNELSFAPRPVAVHLPSLVIIAQSSFC